MEAIDKGQDMRPNFRDGMREIEVLEAGLKSAAEGREIKL
jgi:predicted dehydrogenase